MECREDLAEIERLRAENDQLKNKSVRGLSLKVSEKGAALSLYEMGPFPVTLYKEQWTKILRMAGELRRSYAKTITCSKPKNDLREVLRAAQHLTSYRIMCCSKSKGRSAPR